MKIFSWPVTARTEKYMFLTRSCVASEFGNCYNHEKSSILQEAVVLERAQKSALGDFDRTFGLHAHPWRNKQCCQN